MDPFEEYVKPESDLVIGGGTRRKVSCEGYKADSNAKTKRKRTDTPW
jgi:hypothetical protein